MSLQNEFVDSSRLPPKAEAFSITGVLPFGAPDIKAARKILQIGDDITSVEGLIQF